MPKKRTYCESFTSNPFIQNTLTETKFGRKIIVAKNGTSMRVIDGNDNIQGALLFAREKELEANLFVKVYADGIKKMLELSNAGLRIFAVIQQEMMTWPKGYSSDLINLNYEMVAKPKGIKVTSATWYNGIKDLILHSVIAPTPQTHMYWLNMSCFFRGDRFGFIDTYYLKGSYTKYHEKQLSLPLNDSQETPDADQQNPTDDK